MQLTITSVDYAPRELDQQTPIVVDLLKELPGDDRPDYWLGVTTKPIRWISENIEREVSHVILAARCQGSRIEPGAKNLPVGIAYVVDTSLLDDKKLSFAKCVYIAIGVAHESGAGLETEEPTGIIDGKISQTFGIGTTK